MTKYGQSRARAAGSPSLPEDVPQVMNDQVNSIIMLDDYGFKDISAYNDLDAEQLEAVFAGLEAAVEYNWSSKIGCEQNTVIGVCI